MKKMKPTTPQELLTISSDEKTRLVSTMKSVTQAILKLGEIERLITGLTIQKNDIFKSVIDAEKYRDIVLNEIAIAHGIAPKDANKWNLDLEKDCWVSR